MGINELENFLLGPGDDVASVTSLAENTWDEGGYSRFVLLDTRLGKEVADAARFCEAGWKKKSGSKDLEEEVTGGNTPLHRWKRKEVYFWKPWKEGRSGESELPKNVKRRSFGT